MRTLVLASSFWEASAYVKENHIKQSDFTYVSSIERLKGYRDTELHLLPYWTITKHHSLIGKFIEELRIFEHPAKGNIIIHIKGNT